MVPSGYPSSLGEPVPSLFDAVASVLIGALHITYLCRRPDLEQDENSREPLRAEGDVCEGRGGGDRSGEGGIFPRQRMPIAAPTRPSKVKQAPHPSPVLEIL